MPWKQAAFEAEVQCVLPRPDIEQIRHAAEEESGMFA